MESMQQEQRGSATTLIDQVAVIEAQPLEDRADGFQNLYEQLVEQLERADGNQ